LDSALSKGLALPQRYRWLPANSPFRESAHKLAALMREQGQNDGCDMLLGCAILNETVAAANPQVAAALRTEQESLHAQGIDALSFEAGRRYALIAKIVNRTVLRPKNTLGWFGAKLDKVLTHRFWGAVSFLLIVGLTFHAVFSWAGLPMAYLDRLIGALSAWLVQILPDNDFKSLLLDGVLAGVGSVLVFIPQIAILFFFLGILEDCGYMARAAFVTDTIMRRFGLQGRCFIPPVSSFACAIPGILSTRTIPTFSDRLTTILIAPLMSCSARLPVYSLLIAAFVPKRVILGVFSLQGLTMLVMYLLGAVTALGVAALLRTRLIRGEPAVFIMEMPPFRLPSIKFVLRAVWDRVYVFLRSAGTIILLCSVFLWFLAKYPAEDVHSSYAGRVGHFIEPAIKPLGFNWEIGVSILASFAAREVFVTSLATVYKVTGKAGAAETLLEALARQRDLGAFSLPAALALMVFYVFACQCISTLAVCYRETPSWGWTVFMFAYMGVLAYGASFAVYQLASLLLR
jgi:ferrous iron transport protein B